MCSGTFNYEPDIFSSHQDSTATTIRTSFIMRATVILALLPFIAVVSATLNGHCAGSDTWGEYGICVWTETCDYYGGIHTDGACPDDVDDIKCCVVGVIPDQAHNPCGGISLCEWLDGNGNCPNGLTHITGTFFSSFMSMPIHVFNRTFRNSALTLVSLQETAPEATTSLAAGTPRIVAITKNDLKAIGCHGRR
jgi:hypothetical protein